jgi:hypothetical protein
VSFVRLSATTAARVCWLWLLTLGLLHVLRLLHTLRLLTLWLLHALWLHALWLLHVLRHTLHLLPLYALLLHVLWLLHMLLPLHLRALCPLLLCVLLHSGIGAVMHDIVRPPVTTCRRAIGVC